MGKLSTPSTQTTKKKLALHPCMVARVFDVCCKQISRIKFTECLSSQYEEYLEAILLSLHQNIICGHSLAIPSHRAIASKRAIAL